MKTYKITVLFSRKNKVTRKLEKNCVREWTGSGESHNQVYEMYMKKLKVNEPDLVKIKKVSIEEI